MSPTDSCDWCGRESNKIQMKAGSSISLCIDCCPDISLADVMFGIEDKDDPLPPQWHFMGRNERVAWKEGMSIEEIFIEFEWDSPPERKH